MSIHIATFDAQVLVHMRKVGKLDLKCGYLHSIEPDEARVFVTLVPSAGQAFLWAFTRYGACMWRATLTQQVPEHLRKTWSVRVDDRLLEAFGKGFQNIFVYWDDTDDAIELVPSVMNYGDGDEYSLALKLDSEHRRNKDAEFIFNKVFPMPDPSDLRVTLQCGGLNIELLTKLLPPYKLAEKSDNDHITIVQAQTDKVLYVYRPTMSDAMVFIMPFCQLSDGIEEELTEMSRFYNKRG